MTTETEITPELQARVWAAVTDKPIREWTPSMGLDIAAERCVWADSASWYQSQGNYIWGRIPNLTSGDGMIALLEAMMSKEWWYEITPESATFGRWDKQLQKDTVYEVDAPTRPAAVLLAAAAALRVER